MRTQLEKLARQRDQASWSSLLRALTRLYLEAQDSLSKDGHDLFGDVSSELLALAASESRCELSQSIAPLQSVSPKLVKRLASDQSDVAAPVLEQSPLLSDTELIEIARTMVAEHRLSIARRKELGIRLTAALVQEDESDVITALAGNSGARFSNNAFRKVVEKAKKDQAVLESLAGRDDLPTAVKVQISPFLDETKRADLFAGSGDSGLSLLDSLEDIVAEKEQSKGHASKSKAPTDMLADINSEEDLNDCLAELCDIDDFKSLVQVMAGVSDLPPKFIRSALLNLDGTPIATICKAIGVSNDMFDTLSYMRCQWMKVPHADLITQASSYAELSAEKARKTLKTLVQGQKKSGASNAA